MVNNCLPASVTVAGGLAGSALENKNCKDEEVRILLFAIRYNHFDFDDIRFNLYIQSYMSDESLLFLY